jgi:uncharacterized protein YtpQ (UPF0354 family)
MPLFFCAVRARDIALLLRNAVPSLRLGHYGLGDRMRRILTAFLLVIVVCGVATAQTLSPQAFTAEFAKALQAKSPTATVVTEQDLRLKFRRADGSSATVFLDNVYRDHTAAPQRFEELVSAYAAGLAKPLQQTVAKLDRTRIVPVIKSRAWLEVLQEKFRPTKQEPLFEAFNKELVVVYAEDTQRRTRYLSADEDVGDRADLRARAIANLRRLLPKIEMRKIDEDLGALSAGGDYDASLLLLDDIWSGAQVKFKGDTVVAIPERDALMVTGSQNRAGLKIVRGTVKKLAESQGMLTDTLFVYRDGKFVKFGRD